MKRIEVKSKNQIKELLYAGFVLGIKSDKFKSFGGCQRWRFDKKVGKCLSCGSGWAQDRKRVDFCSLEKAAKILWHHHNSLCVFTNELPSRKKEKLESLCK